MADCPPYDEKALLAKIASGDERAFRKLFDLYNERFYAIALKMTRSDEVAEDIVQDVFMNLWIKKESLVNVVNPSSYFFTAVYRKIYHHYRSEALNRKFLHSMSPVEKLADATEEKVLAHESETLISKAISQLPPQQKLVFKLSKQEGFSRADVAHQLNITPNTVRNHLADAIKFIRNFLRNTAYILPYLFWFFKK